MRWIKCFFDGTYVKSDLSLYKSDNIKLSFNYPADWGNATADSGEMNHGEYIKFTNNKNLFSVAGDFGRGSIVDGVELKTYEKTDILTLDKHWAEVIIYTDPNNKYLIEGVVHGKDGETAEPYYINAANKDNFDLKTILNYKEQFSKIISSLEFGGLK